MVKHRSSGVAGPGDFDGLSPSGTRSATPGSASSISTPPSARLATGRAPTGASTVRSIFLVYTPDGSPPAGAGVGENLHLRRVGGPLISRDAAADVRRRGPITTAAYNGVAPQGYRGQALYLGPTFHYRSTRRSISRRRLSPGPRPARSISPTSRGDLARLRLEVEL